MGALFRRWWAWLSRPAESNGLTRYVRSQVREQVLRQTEVEGPEQ